MWLCSHKYKKWPKFYVWHSSGLVCTTLRLFNCFKHIWVDFPRTEILPVLSHLKKTFLTAVAKPDLLGHFLKLF